MKKPLALLQGPVAVRAGYGDHFRDCVRSFIKLYGDKYDIKIISMRWGSCPLNSLTAGIDDDLISRLFHGNELTEKPKIFIQCTVPNEFQPMGDFNIGITAGIETNICAPEWIEGCNRMNLIIVPSKHSKDVFLNSTYQKINEKTKQPIGELRCNKPIEILFEGLDINIFRKTDELSKTIVDEINDIPEEFLFLSVGHWLHGELGHDRKDIGMLIKIFLETFKNISKAPALVLKTSGATFSIIDRDDILNKIEKIRKTVNGLRIPNIYLLHGDLTQSEMNGLYNHPKIKSMVSFTHGEGFSRPFLEFMASGKPLIVPNWSGHVDFTKSQYCTLLPGQLTKLDKSSVWDKVLLKDSQWHTTNYDYASKVLKDIFKEYKQYVEKSRGSWHYVKTNYSLEIMGEKFKEILDKYLEHLPEQIELKLPAAPLKIQLPKLKKV